MINGLNFGSELGQQFGVVIDVCAGKDFLFSPIGERRGGGDARAAEIYAAAYGRNPEFFEFYRSLNAYKSSFKNKNDVLVLQPDSDFFKYLRKPEGG